MKNQENTAISKQFEFFRTGLAILFMIAIMIYVNSVFGNLQGGFLLVSFKDAGRLCVLLAGFTLINALFVSRRVMRKCWSVDGLTVCR